MKAIINVKDVIGNSKAIESESGEKIKAIITERIKNGNDVVLDFKGITSMLSLFLNPAIGDLYGEFSEEEIRQHLSVENFPQEHLETFKRVVERAKDFYRNKENITKILDEETGATNESDEAN